MREKRPTTRRKGQLGGANSDAASKLACWFGVPGLKRLSDEDAVVLADILRVIISQVHDEAFSSGWNEAMNYNNDVARLNGAGPTTGH